MRSDPRPTASHRQCGKTPGRRSSASSHRHPGRPTPRECRCRKSPARRSCPTGPGDSFPRPFPAHASSLWGLRHLPSDESHRERPFALQSAQNPWSLHLDQGWRSRQHWIENGGIRKRHSFRRLIIPSRWRGCTYLQIVLWLCQTFNVESRIIAAAFSAIIIVGA